MKKLLLILILTHISANAMAEWTWFGGDEDSGTYVDLSTLRKTGSKAKIWVLNNDKPIPGKEKERSQSTKMFFEFDCSKTNIRTIAFSAFSKNMGTGQPVSSKNSPYAEWEPVQPGSLGQTIGQLACEKSTTEWTMIGESEESKDGERYFIYADLGTVTKKKDLAQIWQLVDFKSTDPATQFKNSSAKVLREFNCKDRQVRYLEIVTASGNMGIGTKTRETKGFSKEWEPIITTGSENEPLLFMLFLACRESK